MSVANILDENGKIRPQYIPNIVENKLKAIDECLFILMEALQVEGYEYNGEFQNIPRQPATDTGGGTATGTGEDSGTGTDTGVVTEDISTIDTIQQQQIDTLSEQVTQLAQKVESLENPDPGSAE